MKNIFNHNKHTSTQAHKRTNFVILKFAVVTSILKNLSKHTSLPANKRTSIFSQLSTINHKLLTFCFVLLFISVMLIQSGCSLFGYYKIERYLGNNSICWEDNDHILIYASIAEYHMVTSIGGESKQYDWTGGEIWRITASTGAKELLFREKGGKYWAWDNTIGMRIDAVNGHIYICDELITYKVKDDFSDWDSLGYFTLPNVSSDEKYLVGIDEDGDVKVNKYNLDNNTSEELYVNDYMITWLDYDYARNYLLINSNKFVDLNTGEETVVVDYGDYWDQYVIKWNPYNGKIGQEYISLDVQISNGDSDFVCRIEFDIDSLSNRVVKEKVNGVLSPDKSKYATLGTFTDTLGNMISEWNLPSTEL